MNNKTQKIIPEIQIWNTFNEIPITSDDIDTRLLIKVDDDATPLPQELEMKVNSNWDEVASKKPVKNNPILFLKKPIVTQDNTTTIETNIRGFKYTQAFNRNPEFHGLVDDLNQYKLLSLSTHAHLLTSDNKLLFGTKLNQLNQISGFSGFPNAGEDCSKYNGKMHLNIHGTILNRLTAEMGYLTKAVKNISAVGVVYCNSKGLRGLDTDYLIELDENSDKAKERFEESFQFAKDLYAVEFEPQNVIEFVNKLHEDGKVMSKYALGCQYLIMKIRKGDEAAGKLMQAIQNLGITMSIKNETDYFS